MHSSQAHRNTPNRQIAVHKAQAVKRWMGVVMRETLALGLLLMVQVSLLMVVSAVL